MLTLNLLKLKLTLKLSILEWCTHVSSELTTDAQMNITSCCMAWDASTEPSQATGRDKEKISAK